MFKRILVPLDGSNLAEGVLPYVKLLTKSLNTPAYLIVCLMGPVQSTAGRNLQMATQAYLDAIANNLQNEGLSVTSDVKTGYPASVIPEVAQDSQDWLIAMSTHGRSGVTRWALGSTADKVLHMTSSPVLLVRPKEQTAPIADASIQNIIVPLDGSPLAEQAVPSAIELAKSFKARIALLRVTPEPSDYYRPEAMTRAKFLRISEKVDNKAQDYLTQARKRLSPEQSPSVSMKLEHGDPASVILDISQRLPNSLIAMTTHGRSGINRWLIGSVTDRVVHHSVSPLLILRPQAK